ncbi:MAG: selenoneine biosynthesis selenosugar synthase SenB [Casimicrobiaceae bacterium]
MCIASPASARQNNGNWRTADRWRRMLARDYAVEIVGSTADRLPECEVLIALHARRSAPAIRAFRAQRPRGGLLLALTGTDVYRDIHEDPSAQASIAEADHLVALEPLALAELPPEVRARTSVVYQSAPALSPGRRYASRFDIVQVGHLRPEKDPFTPIRALRCLPPASRIRLTQIGSALDPELLVLMDIMLQEEPRLTWLGMLDYASTRQRIKRAHLLVLASRMEGGAHVIIEAVTSGVPVIASRVSGNIGMLGEDYAGYFEFGDAEECARLMHRAETEPAFLARLEDQCRQRRDVFDPAREARELRLLVERLVAEG